MRKEAGSITGDNIAAGIAPFSPSSKETTEIRPAPFVYVPHLWQKIQSILEQNRE